MGPTGPGRREEERVAVALPAIVRNIHHGLIGRCVIRDASRSGCRLISSAAHRFPDRILIFPRGFKSAFEAEVMWNDGRMVGVRFVHATGAQIRDETGDGTQLAPPDAGANDKAEEIEEAAEDREHAAADSGRP